MYQAQRWSAINNAGTYMLQTNFQPYNIHRKKLQIFTYAINECAGQNHSIFHGFGQQNELRHLHMVLIDQNIYQAWQNL